MKIFFALTAIYLCMGNAFASTNHPIEIYVQGMRYESLAAYKASKEKIKAVPAVNAEDEQFLRDKSQQLGLDFDPKKVKTVQLASSAPISARTSKLLQAIGFEHGVNGVIADFQQDWNNPIPKFTITADELETRIKDLAGDRKEPLLLLSDSKKLRVMALSK